MKSTFKRFTLCGTGGINCRCCVNRGFKPTAKRIAKRRLSRETASLVKQYKSEGK